jgi:tripartite-type tricarboxylate transporter receptor subunit TctC
VKIIDKLLACGECAAATILPSGSLAADAYPSQPIKLVLPFAAGGQSDVVARIAAERLSSTLGQPLVVENVAGAGGMIAASKVARSPADGYTIFLPNASTLTIAPHLQPGSGITPASFTPIAAVSQFPLVLVVNTNSPYKSMADVIAAAKSKPGKLSFATPGVGTTPHLAGETFSQEAGITLTAVPYKGGAPALNDLLAGQVDLYFRRSRRASCARWPSRAGSAMRRCPMCPRLRNWAFPSSRWTVGLHSWLRRGRPRPSSIGCAPKSRRW